MKSDLIKIIAETPIKNKINSRVAKFYERQIQNAIINSERFSSTSVRE